MQKLAIFDFDGTLLMKDTLPILALEWRRQHRSRLNYLLMYSAILPCMLGYKLRIVSRDSFRYLALTSFRQLFRRMTPAEIEAFFDNAYEGLQPYFNPLVLTAIHDSTSNGYKAVLVSGAYSQLLRSVAKNLGIDLYVGSEMTFREGVFDHRAQQGVIEGQLKLDMLLDGLRGEEIDWLGSRSYGNSFSDIPIMEVAGEPVAVNPDSRLREHALKHGWSILDAGLETSMTIPG